MAVISPVITRTADPYTYIVLWETLTENDTATPVDLSDIPGVGGADRSVQVVGTFGSATIQMQGSNDGTNFAGLSDPFGNTISFTATGLEGISELTKEIKPVATVAGTGRDIDIYLLISGRH